MMNEAQYMGLENLESARILFWALWNAFLRDEPFASSS